MLYRILSSTFYLGELVLLQPYLTSLSFAWIEHRTSIDLHQWKIDSLLMANTNWTIENDENEWSKRILLEKEQKAQCVSSQKLFYHGNKGVNFALKVNERISYSGCYTWDINRRFRYYCILVISVQTFTRLLEDTKNKLIRYIQITCRCKIFSHWQEANFFS